MTRSQTSLSKFERNNGSLTKGSTMEPTSKLEHKLLYECGQNLVIYWLQRQDLHYHRVWEEEQPIEQSGQSISRPRTGIKSGWVLDQQTRILWRYRTCFAILCKQSAENTRIKCLLLRHEGFNLQDHDENMRGKFQEITGVALPAEVGIGQFCNLLTRARTITMTLD